MNSFDIAEKIENIKQERLEIEHLRVAFSFTFCPIERQWVQSHLFNQIDYSLELTDELYRYLQKEDEKNINRQTMEFTLKELSNFDGISGRPAYVAINGIIYDVSNEATWGGASHFGLMAGKDLTAQFDSCHGMISVLSRLPKVGILK